MWPGPRSPTGTKVATGFKDARLRIVDAPTGVVEQEVEVGDVGLLEAIWSVAWSP